MRSTLTVALLASAFFAGSAVPSFGQVQAYLSDSDLDQLFSVDLVTGAATLIGSTATGGLGTPAGLAWKDDTQELWTIDLSGGEVGTIDVSTGAFTPVHATGLSGWQSFAWDPTTSLFFASNQSGTFSSIDPVTGAVTQIGTASYVSGMDVDSSGSLWGLSFANGNLYRIDKSTAALTLVSTTRASFGSLSIEPSTGSFFACNSGDDALYSIDPLTGVATLIGAHGAGIRFVKGFEIPGTTCSGRVVRRGTGCTDAAGVTLRVGHVGVPCLGQQLDLRTTSGSTVPYFLVVGLSDTLWLGGVVLPLDLGLFGAPGCWIYASQENLLGPVASGNLLSFLVPRSPLYVGARVYVQGVVIDPTIPRPLPIATSDYLEITIGA